MDNAHFFTLTDSAARQAILDIGRRMYEKGFVASNDGNISLRAGPDTIWATPAGVSKGYMKEEDLVKLSLSGKVLEGSRPASSEIKMHLRVYTENPHAGGAVHAHPPVSTAFAIAGVDLDFAFYPEAIVNLGVVRVAPYARPGSQEVPDSIAPYCREYNAVLLANHGPLAWGRDVYEAFYRLEALENYALIAMYLRNFFGRANELTEAQLADIIRLREDLGIATGGIPRRMDPWLTGK
ncbi:MAG TPA: class II aldolase family protein [Clostridiales bacterium]|nr:class II aldolase family protein [Clostridiales bacterium]